MTDDTPLEPWIRVGRPDRDGREERVVRSSVAVSFGSPAQDSGVSRIDLNDVLIRHPQASFLMRAAGDAMRGAGIEAGDLLLVDRSIAPQHGHVVIAVVGTEFVCRHLLRHDGLCLRAADEAVADIVPGEGEELRVWGVVTTVIRSLPV